MFSYDHVTFRYDPFPIGLATPVMTPELYEQLVSNFPPLDIFESFEELGKKGRKYTLSEKENEKVYLDFVRSSPLWRDFYAWIKSKAFPYSVMEMLRQHDIDLGYRYVSPAKRWSRQVKNLVRGRSSPHYVQLKARFEFSALPADGGHLVPHTDAPTKIVTMIVSVLRKGEWNPSFGGGTDVNQPKEDRYRFNHLNRLAAFDDMEVLHTYEFLANQAVIFVKTFNSWHSVRPMTGVGSDAVRRTLTINIEAMR
jgi:2OG-Fe(II) oxygenase superfamily